MFISTYQMFEYFVRRYDTKPLTVIPACKTLYLICAQNRLPEGEPSVSKYAEDIVKIKILV